MSSREIVSRQCAGPDEQHRKVDAAEAQLVRYVKVFNVLMLTLSLLAAAGLIAFVVHLASL